MVKRRGEAGCLASPGYQGKLFFCWSMLTRALGLMDDKRDDDAKALTGALVRVLEDVKGVKPWDQRLILACWNVSHYFRSPFPP